MEALLVAYCAGLVTFSFFFPWTIQGLAWAWDELTLCLT